jgi:hypothetical protein
MQQPIFDSVEAFLCTVPWSLETKARMLKDLEATAPAKNLRLVPYPVIDKSLLPK